MSIKKDVWLIFEQRDGRVMSSGLELVTLGLRLSGKLGGNLVGVLLGCDIDSARSQLSDYGLDLIYVVDDPTLDFYKCDNYAHNIVSLISKNPCEAVLVSATSNGVDLAATLGARFRTGVLAHCLNADISSDGILTATIPVFGQGMLASVLCPDKRPQIVTTSPGFVEKAGRVASKKTIFRQIPSEACPQSNRIEILEIVPAEESVSKLEAAKVVVAGGYGVGDKEGWKRVEELASEIGGAVGATRPPIDEGWASHDQIIGQSGKIVKPDLYIGIGISGAIHHLLGIQDSKVIVAINTDPKAPLMSCSDYAIIGDYRQILPELLRKLRASS